MASCVVAVVAPAPNAARFLPRETLAVELQAPRPAAVAPFGPAVVRVGGVPGLE